MYAPTLKGKITLEVNINTGKKRATSEFLRSPRRTLVQLGRRNERDRSLERCRSRCIFQRDSSGRETTTLRLRCTKRPTSFRRLISARGGEREEEGKMVFPSVKKPFRTQLLLVAKTIFLRIARIYTLVRVYYVSNNVPRLSRECTPSIVYIDTHTESHFSRVIHARIA